MGFFASLLPGIREIRAPLISGVIWFISFYFLFDPNVAEILKSKPAREALTALGPWGNAIFPASFIFLSYLLGLLADSLVLSSLRRIGEKLRQFLASATVRNIHRRAPWEIRKRLVSLELGTWPFSSTAFGMIIDTIQQKLTSAGAATGSVFLFPDDSAKTALSDSAPQLAHSASILYERYDRVRSEAELRTAVSPPLLAFALAFPARQHALAILASIVAGAVLLTQAVQKTREANGLLSNYFYLGYIEVPVLSTVESALAHHSSGSILSEGRSAGIIASALFNRGYFEAGENALQSIIEEELDFQKESDGDLQSYISDVSNVLKNNCIPLYESWKDSDKVKALKNYTEATG